MENKNKIKRLFFDCETSANIVYSWRIGYQINLTPENIIQERSLICICYKFEGDKKVSYLKWDNGNDKKLVYDFYKVIIQADEIIAHNSKFDEGWFRTRALKHGIPSMPKFTSIDTLRIARSKFNFNSNKLDYISKFLGFEGKTDTGGYGLWKELMVNPKSKAIYKMIKYCQNDVLQLEKVYNKLAPYTDVKTHIGVSKGNGKCSCPACGSLNVTGQGSKTMASGMVKKKMRCHDCFRYYHITMKEFEEATENKSFTYTYKSSSYLPQTKKVIQYSLKGKKIQEFVSLASASKVVKVSANCISKVCRGLRKTSAGFKWKYKN